VLDTLDLLKYAMWGLSTGLAFAGAWFFKFTNEDPKHPGRLILNRAGKIAFPLAVAAFVGALVLQILQDRSTRQKAGAAKLVQDNQIATINKISTSLDSLGKDLAIVLQTPGVAELVQRSSPGTAERVRAVARDPIVAAKVAPTTLRVLSQFGVPESVVRGANSRHLSPLQGNVLNFNAGSGNAEGVQEALDAGVAPDYREDGEEEQTPLIYAVMQAQTKGQDPPGYIDVVSRLLRAKADPNARYKGSTPLWWAAANGHYEIARMLIDAGADVSTPDTETRWSPLMNATFSGHTRIMDLLRSRNARTDQTSASGESLCDIAKRSQHRSAVLPHLAGVCN
jgi:hypothetical protein